MREGWLGDEYIVLFSDDESSAFADACDLGTTLPGFAALGLRGWHDLIGRDETGQTFTIPSVPLDRKYIAAFDLPDASRLKADERFVGKVRWLVKPLVFGGSPDAESNIAWVTHQQHVELVRWWNEQYRVAKASTTR